MKKLFELEWIVFVFLVLVSAFARGLDMPPTAQAKLGDLYKNAEETFYTINCEEFSFTYDVNGMTTKISSSHECNRNQVIIYTNTAGIVHTHPDSERQPSYVDIDVAKKFHIPNYVLSVDELWVALPSGESKRVAFISWRKGKLVIHEVH